jgi:hypothetical protein
VSDEMPLAAGEMSDIDDFSLQSSCDNVSAVQYCVV